MKFKKLSESFSNYMRCPHCTNMTLMPVDGYDDLFICDDCGEELRGILQYDGSYKFKPYNEDDELNESDNTNETWLGFKIACDIETDLDSDVFDLNWETNRDYFDAVRDEAVDKIQDAVNSVEGCSGATMDDWDLELNSNWGSIDYTFDGSFTCTRENVDLKSLQAEIDAALRNIQSHTTTEVLYDGSYTTNYVPYGEQMVPEGDYLNDVDMKVHYDYDTSCTSIYRIGEDGYPIKESVNNPEFVICVFDGDDNRWKMWGGTHTAPDDFNKEEFLARVNNQEFPNFTVINNYTDAKIIPNNGEEYRKLTEGNELEDRAKKHRKHQDGLSPFCYLSESVYKSGDKYYGGLPAEPDMKEVKKRGLYCTELVKYFKENVCKHPGYKILGYSPSTIVLLTPTGKEYLDLCHFDALSSSEEAIEMASHLFESKKKKKYNFNPNAGNVELSAKMFNNMMNPAESPNTNPVSGPFGGDVGASDASGCCESATLEFRAVNNPEFVHMTHDDLFNKVLHKYIKVVNKDTGATLDILVDSVDVDGAGVCGHPVQPKDAGKAARFDYYPKEYIVGWSSAPVSKLNEATESGEERFAFFFPHCGGAKIMNRERAVRQLEFELDNFKNDSGASLAGRGFALYCLESLDDDGTSWVGRYDTKEFLNVLNESESIINKGRIEEAILHDMPDGRYQAIRLNWSHEEVTLTCYDKEADEEFDKWICAGVYDEDTGRRTALKLFKDPAFEIPQDIKNELISTYGLDDFGYKIEEAAGRDDFDLYQKASDFKCKLSRYDVEEAANPDELVIYMEDVYTILSDEYGAENIKWWKFYEDDDVAFGYKVCLKDGSKHIVEINNDRVDEINEAVNPEDLTDCPECGGPVFDSRRGVCTKCSYRESLTEDAKPQYVICGITNEGTRMLYDAVNDNFTTDYDSATKYDDMDVARDDWFKIPRSGFRRIFIPIYDPAVFESVKEAFDVDKVQKRIACTTEFDNGHVFHNDYFRASSAEAEERAKQASIENPDKVFYVKYDDVMNPSSDIKWKNGEKIEESINSSEPAWDEIKAMRQEQAELEARRAARKARFALYHKLFDDKVAEDENAPWVDRVHTMFDEATEIQVVSDPSKVPTVVDGQKVSYKFSVDEIDIFADAYRDYLYIVTTK